MHIERALGVWKERWGMFHHRPSCLSLLTGRICIKCTMILHNMCIDDNILYDGAFNGTRRELSDAWPGDDATVLFNDFTDEELRNIVDVPFATRKCLTDYLRTQGIVAPGLDNLKLL